MSSGCPSISSLNAFIGCNHPTHAHQGQFLICRECHAAIELEQKSISDAIIHSASEVGFVVEGQTVTVDAAYVDARLGALSRDEDLSRYIL